MFKSHSPYRQLLLGPFALFIQGTTVFPCHRVLGATLYLSHACGAQQSEANIRQCLLRKRPMFSQAPPPPPFPPPPPKKRERKKEQEQGKGVLVVSCVALLTQKRKQTVEAPDLGQVTRLGLHIVKELPCLEADSHFLLWRSGFETAKSARKRKPNHVCSI